MWYCIFFIMIFIVLINIVILFQTYHPLYLTFTDPCPSLPACPVGLMRARSSQTASGSAWWPPPPPACGGWTGSAGAWVDEAAGGRVGRCVRRAGCPGGQGRAHRCGSLGRNCSRWWGPQRRPPRCLEHHLPHCNTHRGHWVSLLSRFPEGMHCFVFQQEVCDRWKKWTLILLPGYTWEWENL